MEEFGSIVRGQRGRTIMEGGLPAQHVFKVVSGGLRAIRLLADGRRHVSRFYVPGDLIGVGGRNHCASTVEAVTEATLIRYAYKRFQAFVDASPLARHALLDLLDRERADAEYLQFLACRKNATERLASFLLAFAHVEESRLQVAGAALHLTEVHLWMSRADIADHLGLTTETVSRTLSDLRHRLIIALPTPQRVLVLNLAALHGATATCTSKPERGRSRGCAGNPAATRELRVPPRRPDVPYSAGSMNLFGCRKIPISSAPFGDHATWRWPWGRQMKSPAVISLPSSSARLPSST